MRMRSRVMLGGMLLVAMAAGDGRADAGATLSLPQSARSGQVIEVPVMVEDGDQTLASYAFRLYFSPDVLRVIEIRGGRVPGFTGAPVVDRASFDRGQSDFAAINQGMKPTPSHYEVARIRFEVIGVPGSEARVVLKPSPGGGLVDAASFDLLPARIAGGGTLRVVAE